MGKPKIYNIVTELSLFPNDKRTRGFIGWLALGQNSGPGWQAVISFLDEIQIKYKLLTVEILQIYFQGGNGIP